MDNLEFKDKAVRQAIRNAGARLLFLPACSPYRNLIEQLFVKLKTLSRKAARDAIEAAWGAWLLLGCLAQECANEFARNADALGVEAEQMVCRMVIANVR